MKRRNFFKNAAGIAMVTQLTPNGEAGTQKPIESFKFDRKQWEVMGKGLQAMPDRKKTVAYDVVVVGAGMAGICAAVASARNGAKTVLINDRPVLGGNASSEIRVTVNGVAHLKPKGLPERETGIIEEILIENRARNPQESYPVWDHVLYDFVTREPNLTLMLNTQAMDAVMKGDRIKAARCWQLTTETEFMVEGQVFVDCSGDGLLAAKAGAIFRTGREAASEFDEKYAPKEADGWQMGASILMQAKDMGRPMPYTPPAFVIKYDAEKAHDRAINQFIDGFWWVELGSEFDIIDEQEDNRHKLMGYLHGVWDYVKNSGEFPESENFALDWVGALPGRRESRRFIGDFILSEKDLTGHRHYPDAIGFGGWSLDEHNPGGIERLDLPPSFFHEKFAKVYEVPFRCLYSKNIANLMFSGRNVSQTHIALSSTRIQATCALMGQATGTAATLCVKLGVLPRDIAQKHMAALQEQLLRDDVFIPLRPAQDPNDLAIKASSIFGSSTTTGQASLLTDGMSRDIDDQVHHWQSDGLPAYVQLEWEKPVDLSAIEIKCDSNLQRNIMMRKDHKVNQNFGTEIPPELLKTVDFEVRIKGQWVKVGQVKNNITRLVKTHFQSQKTTAVRINMTETYGADHVKLFEVRCYS